MAINFRRKTLQTNTTDTVGLRRKDRETKQEPTEFKGFVIRHYHKSDFFKIDYHFAAYTSVEVCKRVIETFLKNRIETK